MNENKARKQERSKERKGKRSTYASIRRPSPRIVGVRRVKLGARFYARGGHGIWAGHRYVARKKAGLRKEKIVKQGFTKNT